MSVEDLGEDELCERCQHIVNLRIIKNTERVAAEALRRLVDERGPEIPGLPLGPARIPPQKILWATFGHRCRTWRGLSPWRYFGRCERLRGHMGSHMFRRGHKVVVWRSVPSILSRDMVESWGR